MSFELILPFLQPIEALLLDPTISEIMVNPNGSVWIEQSGLMTPLSEIRFESGALATGLEVIANRFQKKLDGSSPILNLRLPDGSRLAAMIPPLVNPDPLLTIRKFTSRNFSMEDLIERRMLTRQQSRELTSAVNRGDNVLIAGGTGGGKTTLLNVLADSIPDTERILLIEDTAELHIRKPHVVQTEAQMNTHRNPITFDDLLKAILRHRPDRIVVGEVRGAEASTLVDAMNTGHRGMLTTIHASSCAQAIDRLATLANRANGSPGLEALQREVNSSVQTVVFVERRDGHRLVSEIVSKTELR